MQTNLLRSVAGILLGGAAIAAVGCGSDAVADADALLGPIEQAVASPTGTLGASNATDVFTGAAMAGFLTDSGYIYDPQSGTTGFDVLNPGVTAGVRPWTWASKYGTGPRAMVIEYDDVCSSSGNVCFTGTEARVSGLVSTLHGRELEITPHGGETRVVRSGSKVVFEAGSGKGARPILDAHVIFDDAGRSYTLSAAPGVESGEVTITASNGTFTCTYRDRGEHGRCAEPSGAPAFDW
jgi:hypothetical protein